MNLEKYVEDKPKLKKLYQHSFLTSKAKTNISYLALHSREKWVTAIFDLDEMKIIGTIDIDSGSYAINQEIKFKDKEGKIRTIKPTDK